MSNSQTTVENQKRVMLLYNKDAKMNILKNQDLYLNKITKVKDGSCLPHNNSHTQNINTPSS